MILTLAEDYTSSVELDSGLTGTPESGLYFNKGVHPYVNVSNLLEFMPSVDFTFSDYAAGTTYGNYDVTESKTDIVTYNSKIYLSVAASNQGNTPDASQQWIETNLESIRLRRFISGVKQSMFSALKLNRRLIENQYIYNIGEKVRTLPNDYSGWVFEPKGSDYVKIRINEICLQATTGGTVDLYVVNQGQLIDTLTLTPDSGRLTFESLDYTISGKGRFIFAFDSQEVKSDGAYNDSLRYDGFVCYPVVGTGASAQGATYSNTNSGNGLNFNVSCYLDSSQYVTNNLVDFCKMFQVQFEYDALSLFLTNPNNVSTGNERNVSGFNKQELMYELKDMEHYTVAKKYSYEKKKALESINKTFDKFILSRRKIKSTVI